MKTAEEFVKEAVDKQLYWPDEFVALLHAYGEEVRKQVIIAIIAARHYGETDSRTIQALIEGMKLP